MILLLIMLGEKVSKCREALWRHYVVFQQQSLERLVLNVGSDLQLGPTLARQFKSLSNNAYSCVDGLYSG